MPRTALSDYHKKRDLSLTSEPRGTTGRIPGTTLEFVIQKHGAQRLHYDFRLELDGVMKSWAVTRGPSYDPDDKRLAVRTEDHPIEYNYFEGVIPARQYGAGPVMIWDQGTWSPDEDPHLGLAKGHLTFHIDGTRMHGKWHLVRMHAKEKRENWLLIKSDDEYAMQGKPNLEFLDTENTSAVSGRTLDEIEDGVTRRSPRARTRDGVKSQCGLEQEFVIGGFMPAKHDAQAVGALLLGYYKKGALQYAGKVGTGFSQRTAQDIHERLSKLKTAQSPFPGTVERGRRDYVWVKPEQLCEVSFREWTADKHIRHAVFKGLREEKPQAPPKGGKSAGVVTIEGIVITHPEREVFPGAGITKGDVAEYYHRVMEYLFPFAEGRLLSLMRCTETIAGECFFQRAPMKGGSGNVMGFTSTHKGSKHTYLYTDSPAGIIELAQMNAIEFHAWQSRVDDINKPDQLVFDLDPAEDLPFAAVKFAAQDVRQRLKTHGLQSFPRLTGGKGIHVVAPIAPNHEWGVIKKFAQQLAQAMQRDTPQAYTANMSKAKRAGKIFIDYLRNDYSATAIVPFSLRARPGAPIAVPLNWSELENVESAHAYAYKNHKEILNVRLRKSLALFFSTRQELEI
jgi:DNA ligase D